MTISNTNLFSSAYTIITFPYIILLVSCFINIRKGIIQAMKYCTNCGAEYQEHDRFCSSCGKPVDADIRVQPTETFFTEKSDSVDIADIGNAAAIKNINKKIESHLVKAIISTVCCCLPFGIAAIIFAAQVGPKLAAGDTNAAREASEKANMWSNLAIGMGILMQILWLGLYRFTFNNILFEFLQSSMN